ncbi:MAG: hypothetical protein ACK4NV_19870, partial [Pannonibacter sp.]
MSIDSGGRKQLRLPDRASASDKKLTQAAIKKAISRLKKKQRKNQMTYTINRTLSGAGLDES